MQVLRRHKKIVLIVVLLVVILIVSLLIVQNTSKPSPTSTPSPTPTEISPTPTGTTSPTPTVLSTPTPVPTSSLYPGEVTQYQDQILTPISVFIEDLVQHPDVSIDGTQYINQSTYRLTVTGLVNQTLEYTYDDVVNDFQSYQKVVTLNCVEGWSATILWQGVLLSDLLQKAGASPNATTLIFDAYDGYTTSLPLDYVVQNNLILAYKMNNVTLPASAGWPFMLVAQDQWGYKWIKWVTSIDVSNDSSYLGYWESQGYPNNATIGDPNNATPHWDNVPVAVAIAIPVAATVIAAVMLSKRKRSKIKAKN